METSNPTARALLAIELVQGSPGITADRLLREAGIPIEAARGPYGGYRVGRGLRLPPLTFSAAEALGLVMAVLDGHHNASEPTDPVGSALGKPLPESQRPASRQAPGETGARLAAARTARTCSRVRILAPVLLSCRGCPAFIRGAPWC